jgi:ATP-binding protein involved in chromosome partitioning
MPIRETSDAGTPIAGSAPDSEPGQAFAAIAGKIWQQISTAAPPSSPKIVIE